MEIEIAIAVDFSDLDKYEKQIDAELNRSASGPVEQAVKQWGLRYRSFVQIRFDRYSKGSGDWKPLAASTVRKRRKGSAIEKRIKSTKQKIKKLKHSAKSGKPIIPTKRPNPAASSRPNSRKKKWSIKGLKKSLNTGYKNTVKGVKSGLKTFKKYRKERAKAKVRNEKLKSLNNILKKLQGANNVSILRDIGLLFTALQPVFSGKPGSIEQRIPYGIRVGFGGPSKHGDAGVTIADIAAIHQFGLGHVPKREIIVDPSNDVIEKMSGDMGRALKKLSSQMSSGE